MTCREKLKIEHPEKVMIGAVGGCEGCPSNYGYMGVPEYCGKGTNIECTKCWDREIPESDMEEDNKSLGEIISEGVTDAYNKIGISLNDAVSHILDSGNRREFESGAVRDMQEGKGRCDLLPLDVVGMLLMDDQVLMKINNFQANSDVLELYDSLDAYMSSRKMDMSTMLLEVAKHFEDGCAKYGENNWRKGIPVKFYIDSGVRHYLKYLRGDKDEPHDRAFCWNILCAIWTCLHIPELNDYNIDEKED